MKISLKPADDTTRYDVVVGTCGYESRSVEFLRSGCFEAARRFAFGYGSHKTLSYESNLAALRSAGFTVSDAEESEFPTLLDELLKEAEGKIDCQRPLQVFADISCMTRLRLAQLVQGLSTRRCDVDIYYSLAKFSPPPLEEPPNEFLEPVSSFYSGWSPDIELPVAVISGLGYENMRAIGLIDHLDAANVWLFFPESPISKYDDAVRRANALLLRDISASHVIRYPVENFSTLCGRLFGLTAALRANYRCAILPLGPKLFALASLLAGALYRDVSVWRASAGGFAEPKERAPSGKNFRVRLVLEPDTEL